MHIKNALRSGQIIRRNKKIIKAKKGLPQQSESINSEGRRKTHLEEDPRAFYKLHNNLVSKCNVGKLEFAIL